MAAIDRWISSGGDADVAVEAMSHVVTPGVTGLEADAGLGRTVTISGALLPLDELKVVADVMTRCLAYVCVLEPTTYAPFLRAVEDWCYPSRITFSQGAADPKWFTFARRTARRSIEHLLACLPERAGVRSRLIRLSARCRLGVKARIDPSYDALFPGYGSGDWVKEQRRQAEAIGALVAAWSALPPVLVAERLAHYGREAAQAGETHESQSIAFCQRLAAQTQHPLEYATELISRRASADLVAPFVGAAMKHGSPDAQHVVESLLDDATYKLVAIAMCLHFESIPTTLTNRAIRECDASVANLIGGLVARDELKPAAIEHLLNHSVVAVARATAIAIRGTVPTELHTSWEAAIVRCPADDYWYSLILKDRPSLFVRWIAASADRAEANPHLYEPIPPTLAQSAATMSLDDRLQLIQAFPTSARRLSLDDVFTSLVGKDLLAYQALLDRSDLKNYHACGLAGRPDASWFERAMLAIEHGWSPEDTINAAYLSEHGGWGDDSDHFLGRHDSFEGCRADVPKLHHHLIDVALAYFDARRTKANSEEKAEAVTGIR